MLQKITKHLQAAVRCFYYTLLLVKVYVRVTGFGDRITFFGFLPDTEVPLRQGSGFSCQVSHAMSCQNGSSVVGRLDRYVPECGACCGSGQGIALC
ncbi:MAG: hypothetical protein KIG22_05130, partial [Oxalobacter sp.]|nr:hypothetical protein [Oxalobacter sp.]